MSITKVKVKDVNGLAFISEHMAKLPLTIRFSDDRGFQSLSISCDKMEIMFQVPFTDKIRKELGL